MTWIQLNDLICPLYLAESNEPLASLLVFNSIHSVFVDHLVANSKSISNTIILYPMFHSSWTWSYSDRTIQLYYPFFPYNFLLKFKISSPPFYIYDTPRNYKVKSKILYPESCIILCHAPASTERDELFAIPSKFYPRFCAF